MIQIMDKEIEEKVCELYLSGKSTREASIATKISQTQIRRILSKYNISARSIKTSDDLEDQIIQLYNDNISSEKIAKQFDINGTTVCRILKRRGIELRSESDRHRTLNLYEDFFSVIDTQEKAYLLGFLYADGSVHKDNNMIKIEVHEKDQDILELFIQNIFNNCRPKIGIDREVYRYITITSKQLKEDLIKHGCTPQKTFTVSLPTLNNEMLSHFLRGLYDGDGCICTTNNQVSVTLTGLGTFLKQIQDIYTSLNIRSYYVVYKKNKKIGDLCVRAVDEVNKLLRYLYSDARIYLQRKYQAYQVSQNILVEKLTAPIHYDTNLFSYQGIHVSGTWIGTQPLSIREECAIKAFEYFRKYGFPYSRYSDDELRNDFVKLQNSKSIIDNKQIKSVGESGLGIFRHFCDQYYTVTAHNRLSMLEAFSNDKILLDVIRNRLGITHRDCFNLTGNMIKQGLRTSYRAFAASVFKPTVAKCIYDTFAPNNSIVLDISAGFGQRMLGAMASNKISKYIGLEPWDKQISSISNMVKFFEFKNVELHNIGSEIFDAESESIDFCFSSPPFFTKEIYTNQNTQAAHNRSFEEFLNDWWLPTATMVHKVLKPKSLFVLNMNEEIAYKMLYMAKDLFKEIDKVFISYIKKHLNSESKDMFFVLEKI
jgi:hypothetical protein